MEQSNAEVMSWQISHADLGRKNPTTIGHRIQPAQENWRLRSCCFPPAQAGPGQSQQNPERPKPYPAVGTHCAKVIWHSAQTDVAWPTHLRIDAMGMCHWQATSNYGMVGTSLLIARAFCPVIRDWRSGATMHTVPLPGMQFFDAWRIRPSLTPDPKMGEKLPLLGTEELIPEEPPNVDYGQSDRADIQHRQEQERDVRGAAKTIAQLALELSHVHRLATLITEKADLLKDLAMRRKSCQEARKRCSRSCQDHCSTCLGAVTCPSTGDTYHRESGPA